MSDLIPPSPKYDPLAPPPPDDHVFFASDEPLALFTEWFKEARSKEPSDPNSMALATVDDAGLPDVRMVLLKDFDARGFTFYTNAESAKGRQLAAHPAAAIVLHWKSLKRQVRARGAIAEVTAEEADAYFASRDRGARLGAWASEQSRPLETRFALEKRVAEFAAKFGLGEVPRPPHWTGYRLAPVEIEFWRDRPFRLHDRLKFSRPTPTAPWSKQRLYP
ncbi:MAG: pyridoxamine 5'-phosphate oxidase [Hyphomonadaceae bacterium]|nr:pyridoxamine 5'-phosphate oxidase [Hyphomonadaceae bacterium]